MGKNNRRKKACCCNNDFKEMGFVLLVFGSITICAFFLPVKAWIVLLGIVFIICGIQLIK